MSIKYKMSKKSHRRSTRKMNVRRKTRRGGVKLRNILTGTLALFGAPASAPNVNRSTTYNEPAGPKMPNWMHTEPKFPVYTLPDGRPDPSPKPQHTRGNAATLGRYPIIRRNNRGYTINTTQLFDRPAGQQFRDIISFTTPEGTKYENFFNEEPYPGTIRAYRTVNNGTKKFTLKSGKNFWTGEPIPKTLSGVTMVKNINAKRGIGK